MGWVSTAVILETCNILKSNKVSLYLPREEIPILLSICLFWIRKWSSVGELWWNKLVSFYLTLFLFFSIWNEENRKENYDALSHCVKLLCHCKITTEECYFNNLCYLKKLVNTFVNCDIVSVVTLHPEELS